MPVGGTLISKILSLEFYCFFKKDKSHDSQVNYQEVFIALMRAFF